MNPLGMEGTDGLEVYEVIIGNRRYFATKVGNTEVTVRIPLELFNDRKPHMLEEYADELVKKVQAERRRQYQWNNKDTRIRSKLEI